MTPERQPGERGYETSEIDVARLVLFTVVTVAGCGVLMAAMVWLYGHFELRERELVGTAPPATRVPLEGPERPPAPVIQGAPGSRFELQDPSLELADQRAKTGEILTTSAWVARDAGIVRIPIEHAKRLVLDRGFPVREAPGGRGAHR
jgi:hypothetical protein